MNVGQIISRAPDMVLANARAISHRIDPNPFRPKYIDSDIHLDKFPKVEKLGRLLLKGKKGLSGGATPLGANYLKDGIRFIRTGEVNDCWIDGSECVFISKEDDNAIKRSRLSAGDVLLTITGACFGKSAVVPNELLPANISQHSVRIRTTGDLNPYFLVAFLNCSTGQLQIFKQTVGSTRQAIDYIGIQEIRLPIPDRRIQHYIGAKVKLAEHCRIESEKIRKNLLEIIDELYANAPKVEDDSLSTFASIDDLENDRIDAWHYQRHFINLSHWLKNTSNFTILSKIGSLSKERWNPSKCNPSEKVKYVEISGLDTVTGELFPHQIVVSEAPSRARKLIKTNDILISTVRPNRGAISVVPKYLNNSICSTGFAVYRVKKEIDAYYLSAILKHPVSIAQIMRWNTGSAYPAVEENVIQKVYVPTIGERAKNEISRLECKRLNLISCAQQYLAEAKSDIEALVEGELDVDAIQTGKLKPPQKKYIFEDINKDRIS